MVRARPALLVAVLLSSCSREQVDLPQTQTAVRALSGIDLVIRRLEVPKSAEPGDYVVVSYRICNEGDTFVDWSDITYYLSSDSMIDTGDLAVWNMPIIPLFPGQCDRNTTSFISPVSGAFHLGAIIDPSNLIAEGDETNNIFNAGDFAVGIGPELVVTRLTGSKNAIDNAPIRVEVRVCNYGNQPAQADVSLYLSPDQEVNGYVETYPPIDSMLGQLFSPGAINPGKCRDLSYGSFPAVLPAPFTSGTYYLGAHVDEIGAVTELIETNNEFIGDQINLGYGPDLVITALQTPASALNYATFDVSATVCNYGTTATGGAQVSIYLEPGHLFAGSFNSLSLGRDECGHTSGQVTAATQSSGNGEYRIVAVIDENNQRPELNEANNTFTGGVMGMGLSPDLTIRIVDAPASVTPGELGEVVLEICNRGTGGASNLVVHYEVWENYTGYAQINQNFNAGQCRVVSTSVGIGAPAPWQGVFELVATVDLFNNINELVESNNRSEPREINVGYGPDMVVTQISAPEIIVPFRPVEITVTTCNQGTYPGGYGPTNIYLTRDEIIDSVVFDPYFEDIFVGTITPLEAPNPGRCVDTTATFSVPAWFDSGAYHLAAIINDHPNAGEINNDNNRFLGSIVGLGDYTPDFKITELRVAEAVQYGSPARIEARVCNQGAGSALFTRVNLSLSFDNIPGTMEMGGGPYELTVGSLQYNSTLQGFACVELSGMFPLYTIVPLDEDPVYYLLAIADPTNATSELIESNNLFNTKQVMVGSHPDLVIASVKAPPSVSGGPFEAEVEVCNRGTAAAPGTFLSVNFYFSDDREADGFTPPTWTYEDTYLGTAYFSESIPAQECRRTIAQLNAVSPPSGRTAYYLAAIVDDGRGIAELNNQNNEYVTDLIGFGSGADLVVRELHVPHSAGEGAAIEVSALVCNQGTVGIEIPPVEIYASTNADVETFSSARWWVINDAYFGAISTTGYLQPGACAEVSGEVLVQGTYFSGAHYIAAYVGEFSLLNELISTNNLFVGPQMGIGFGPDLVVTALHAPTSAFPSSTFDVEVEVCNYGTQEVNGAEVNIYVSADTSIHRFDDPPPQEDSWVGTVSLSTALPPEGCRTFTASVYALYPPGGSEGSYYLGAIVDDGRWIAELNESNNVYVGDTIGIGNAPDLVARATRGPVSLLSGTSAPVEVEICNEGTLPAYAGATAALYLSADTELDGELSPGGEDLFLGIASLTGALYPEQCRVASTVGYFLAIPPDIFGSYYLGAVVDELDSVSELDESNNHFVGGRAGVGQEIDLTIGAIDAPHSVEAGGALTVSMTLCNRGTWSINGTQAAVYLSEDAGEKGILLGYVGFPYFLDAGVCRTSSHNFYAFPPVNYQPGQYYLVGVADDGEFYPELDETNNFLTTPILLGTGPDLVVTQLSGPAGATSGSTINIQATVCNYGTAESASAEVNVYFTGDTVVQGFYSLFPGVDTYAGTLLISGGLDAGQCEVAGGTVFAQVPGPQGGYYLGAIVDEANSVGELSETNNSFLGNEIALGSGPDLVVTSIGGPHAIDPGFGMVVGVQICNRGTVAANIVDAWVYLSADREIRGVHESGWPSDDTLAGVLSSSAPLAAGACVSVGGFVFANLPYAQFPGPYYLGAIADGGLAVSELIESNNEYVGAQLGIGSQPDLVVAALSSPPKITPYSSFNAPNTVCNTGTAPSVESTVGFYFDNALVGSRTVPVLERDECHSETTFIPNSYFYQDNGAGLVARADHTSAVEELFEDNNEFSGPRMIIDMFFCGNGWLDVEGEECDDENFVSGDGCTDTCLIEICGDSAVNNSGVENCDDGNTLGGDGCSNTCRVEFCGDSTVNNSGTEQCDDGNLNSGDGCSASCVAEVCGDNVVTVSLGEECDDGNLTNWDGCDSTCQRESPRFGEVGTLSMNQPNRSTWYTVTLQRTYKTPVVIMENVSSNDTDPAHVRVRNVTPTSFEWQIEEWLYQDGAHGSETVNYLVVEAGRRVMEDGTIVEAGVTTANNTWKQINYSQAFGASPTVFTSVNSAVDTIPVITRTRGNAVTAFQVLVQEEEAQPQAHGTETVSWVAFEVGNGVNNGRNFIAGKTPDAVTNALYAINFAPAFTAAPIFFSHADRQDAVDTVAARWSLLTASSVRVRMEEETSLAAETAHTSESVNWLAWSEPGFVTFEATASEAPLCNDLLDNDGDGLLDCSDPQCAHVSPCP
jgi:cysteine-rich repeat protein